MTELTQLRDYCEFLDEVQGEIDLDALISGVRPTPAPAREVAPQRLRRGWAVGVAVAVLVLLAFLPLTLRPGDETPPADVSTSSTTEGTTTTSLPPATTTSIVPTTWPPASPFEGRLGYYQNGAIRLIGTAGDAEVLLRLDEPNANVGWSPDRTRIAIVAPSGPPGLANPPPPNELSVMDVDGTNAKVLYSTDGIVQWPEWSPDGTRIGFRFYGGEGDGDGLVEVGSGAITAVPDGFTFWDYASWSPDGTRIALTGPEPGIHLTDAEFTTIERLTTGNDIEAVWSPDGTRVAFLRAADDQDPSRDGADIYLMDPDGTNRTRLTRAPIHWAHQHPSLVWSPGSATWPG